MQNEGGRTKIELTGIAATEKSLRMMTGIASWTRYLLLFTVCIFAAWNMTIFIMFDCLSICCWPPSGPPLCLPVNEPDTQAEPEL